MMRGDSGSVFVESMIAAAIVALALAAMYHAIGDGLTRNRMLDQRQTALLVAQSELSAVGSEIPLEAGMTGGTNGPYAWRVDVEPYGSQDASDTGMLWQVTVSVRALEGGRELVRLNSLSLGPAG